MDRRVEFVGSIIVFFVLLFVYSKWGPAIPFSTTTQYRGEPMIVSAEGKTFVTPDTATFSFGIEENGQSLKQVQDRVNKKSQSLVAEVKKFGVDEKDIKTTHYNIYPEREYQTGTNRITGYNVSIGYIVKIRDFDKINELLTLITNSGANNVSGINFEVSDDLMDQKLNEARKIASDKAKDKAHGLAKASGITLGKIINVSENNNGGIRPYPMERSLPVTNGEDEQVTQPEIVPGESEISITISLSYEVR
jgi:hypothetical protein